MVLPCHAKCSLLIAGMAQHCSTAGLILGDDDFNTITCQDAQGCPVDFLIQDLLHAASQQLCCSPQKRKLQPMGCNASAHFFSWVGAACKAHIDM